MASVGSIDVPVTISLNGTNDALDQLILMKALEKMGARNRQLHAEVERLRKKNGELEKERVGLTGMNAQWRLRVQELEHIVEQVMPDELICCGNGCCG